MSKAIERRTFVEWLGAAATGHVLKPGLSAARQPNQFRAWTWVHAGSEPETVWRSRMARWRECGIDGVLVSGGDTAMIAAAAHAEQLEFHAWTWIMNRSGDAWAKAEHPEWFDVSRKGDSSLTHPPYVGYYQWFCPTRTDVRDYLCSVVTRVAEIEGVDAVHLDYIRHPDVILPRGLWSKYNLVQDHELPEYDFCYCSVCRDTFQQQSGYDPMSLADPSADRAWREFRWNSITEVVRRFASTVHAHNCLLSAAVFPTPQLARMQVRQAWDLWPLDAVFPMTYHRFHSENIPWIGSAVREGVAAMPASTPVYAGLYLPDLDPAGLALAINVVKDAGGAGVSLFDAGGLSDAHLSVLRSAVG